MQIIKNIVIQKAKKDNDKSPDRKITAKVGDEWVQVASGWIKKDKNGNDYVSCAMSKAWVNASDNSKSRKGFVIVTEEDLKALFEKAGEDYPADEQN